MKRVFVLLFFIPFLFVSCIFNSENTSQLSSDEKKDTDDKFCSIVFYNNTNMDVNVYDSYSPYYMTKPSVTIPADKKITYKTQPSKNKEGTAFYFEYIIKIGDYSFPYWPGDYYSTYINEKNDKASYGYKNIYLENNKTINLEIDELQNTPTKSAFILVENNTNSDIYLKLGSSSFIPYNRVNKFIKSKTSEIYEVNDGINRENQPTFEYAVIENLKVRINEKEINFPTEVKNIIHSGNIYTVSVNTDEYGVSTASLKSITPFNLDTQKKIWAFDNQTFSSVYSICMRPSLDKKSTYVMGTRVDDETIIGYIKINEYGKYTEENNNFFSYQYDEKSEDIILETEVIDFIEQTDNAGNSVLVSLSRLVSTPKSNLVNGELRDDDDLKEFYIISSYDCKNYSLKWKTQIKSVLFRNDSKNKICAIGKDKIAITGAYLDDDYQIHYCLIYVDGSQNDVKVVPVISTESNDFENSNERMLTSAYFYNNNIYFCGYENWKSDDYSTTHLGKVWKIALEDLLNEDNSIFTNDDKVIYSTENSLFFSIEGNNSDFVVCGEYTDNGKILKGCFVTKKMIESDDSIGKKPVLYVENERSYCWCNQVCMYDDKIVLCGKAANSFNGSKNPVSFVVAYDNNQKKLWNVTYDYPDALNIIPNTIGTFLLQLRGQNNTIHYVNADLLGNEKH